MRPLSFSLLFLLLAATGYANVEQTRLEPKDVRAVLEQMLDYHIDQDEMGPELARRAVEKYLTQFDGKHIYFLKGEVERYILPTEEYLQEAVAGYYANEFSQYRHLDLLIQKAIQRARSWRQGLPRLLDNYLESEEELALKSFEEVYPETEEELFERMEADFLRFLKQQENYVGKREYLKGRENDVLHLYQTYRHSYENKYLYQNENGRPLTPEAKEHQFLLRLLKAMAKSLDAHSSFFSAAEAYEMKARLEKGFSGIGIVLQQTLDGISIMRLVEGGPAEESRMILPRDRIVEINGKSILDWSFEKVLEEIRGKEGEPIRLGLERIQQGKKSRQVHFFRMELIRRQIALQEHRVDVSHEEVPGGIIGKIQLHSFYDGSNGVNSERDVRDAIRELKRKGNLKGLVLDLRENAGGFLIQAVKVAGLFITNGVIVVSKYSDGQVRYFRDIDGYAYYDGPLVVLTSRASASAAEIVAQALQDYGAAVVVGDDRTYGKGSVQHQTVTDDQSSSFFKVTVGGYYTASGKSTQIEGVKSDILVPSEYYRDEVGEEFLQYPLHFDPIASTFKDLLWDIEPQVRYWYMKYYIPSLEKPEKFWEAHLTELREKSRERLTENEDFQRFLKGKYYKEDDLQMGEAVRILEDMVEIQARDAQIVNHLENHP